jgi:predicted Rossmann fold nucleotide-binding protein DprA/Smf involved in DNA uptake
MTHPDTLYWLTLINESGLKLNLVKIILQHWCVTEQRAAADLFDLSPLEWSTTFGLGDDEAERAAALRDKLARATTLLAQWQAQGLEPVLRTDPRYPRRMAHLLPPAQQPLVLWGHGNLALLNEPAIAVLGEQPPNAAAAKFIDELMRVLVAEEIGLVSGYGRGLDRTTFEMMLSTSGGRAVVILPLGLSAFAKTTAKLEAAVSKGQIVLVSPFAPETPFHEKLAEARNLLIDYLALGLLVLDTNDDAQMRAGAALERGLPVYVGMTDTAATRGLLDQGALLLTDTGEVVEMVQQAMIDDSFMEEAEAEPALAAAPVPLPAPPVISPDATDTYALRPAEMSPLDSDDALEILSLGGEVPEVLRRKLKKAKNDKA